MESRLRRRCRRAGPPHHHPLTGCWADSPCHVTRDVMVGALGPYTGEAYLFCFLSLSAFNVFLFVVVFFFLKLAKLLVRGSSTTVTTRDLAPKAKVLRYHHRRAPVGG